MKKFLIPLALAALVAPMAASAQYYNTPDRVSYDRNGNAYYDNRPVDQRYSQDRWDRDHRDQRYDRRDNRRDRNRYQDERVVCRDVIVRDRNEGAAIAGALIGGVLGNQVGSGSGRTAATVGGAVVGGLVGNEVGRDRHGNQIERRCERVRY